MIAGRIFTKRASIKGEEEGRAMIPHTQENIIAVFGLFYKLSYNTTISVCRHFPNAKIWRAQLGDVATGYTLNQTKREVFSFPCAILPLRLSARI